MKVLSLIITIPFALCVILFALNNRQDITFDALGLGYDVTLPLYLFTFGVFLIAFIVGGFITWLNSRMTVKTIKKEIKALKLEIENLKSKNLILQDQLPEATVVIEQDSPDGKKPPLKLISSED